MALRLADRVLETSESFGTGTLDLGGAVAGYHSFIAGVGDGNQTYYCIVSTANGQWEVGQGTVVVGVSGNPDRLTRDVAFDGSSGLGVLVDFEQVDTPIDVFCTVPAEKMQVFDPSGGLNIGSDATIQGDLTVGGRTTFNGNTYVWPATQAANKFLMTDGSGNLSWSSILEYLALNDLSDVALTSPALGDLLARGSSTWVNVAGNSTATLKVLAQTGNGSTSALPTWHALVQADITDWPLTAARGGTGQSTLTTGDTLYANGTNTIAKLAIGSAGKIYRSTGTVPAWSSASFPDTAAAGDVLVASGANTWSALTVASTAGTFLRSTGSATQWSTLALPNGATTGDLLTATSGNTIGVLAIGSAGKMLRSSGGAPAWSTAVFPDTATSGDLLYASSANTWGSLAVSSTAGTFLRSTGSAPGWSTLVLPNAATAGDVVYASSTNTLGTLGIAGAGSILRSTGSAPAWSTAAFPADAAAGDLLYASAIHTWSQLTIGSANRVLTSDGTVPVWSTTIAASTTGSAATLTTARSLWGQNFNGSGDVTGSLTSVGDITGGASSMTITAGTGNSRTLTLRTTTSGGVATAFLTGNADQSSVFGGNISGTGSWTITGGAGSMTIIAGTGNSRTITFQTTTSGGVASTVLTLNADGSANFAGAVTATSFSGSSSSAATLSTTRSLWGQNFNGSADVTGSLTSVGDITGGASSMTITAGTGNSRTLTFKTTTSGGAATTALTLNADQTATFAANISGTGAWTVTGGAGNMTIVAGTGNSRTLTFQTTTSGGTATTALTLNADQSATFAGLITGNGGATIPTGHTLSVGTSTVSHGVASFQLPSATSGAVIEFGRAAGTYSWHIGVAASNAFQLYTDDGTTAQMTVETDGRVTATSFATVRFGPTAGTADVYTGCTPNAGEAYIIEAFDTDSGHNGATAFLVMRDTGGNTPYLYTWVATNISPVLSGNNVNIAVSSQLRTIKGTVRRII